MKKNFCVFSLFIGICYLSASGSLLTIHAGNDFYRSQDRIDTTGNDNDLYFDFGFGLVDIGGSGLSFHSDFKATNAYVDEVSGASSRKLIDITTGYLDWRSDNRVFGARLGRQLYTNLAFDSYDFDGLSIAIEPTRKSTINLGAGLLVPPSVGTPYDEPMLLTNPGTNEQYIDTVTRYEHTGIMSNPGKSMVAMLDGTLSMLPFTTLTYGLSLVPAPYMRAAFRPQVIPYTDSTGTVMNDSIIYVWQEGDSHGDVRMALGADIAPVSFLRFTGSGRYSVYHKGLDRYDARLRFIPGSIGDISFYFLGEKGRIDSTSYFSMMFFKQLREIGLTANFYSGPAIAVQLDFHSTSFADEGRDHFLSFDASHRYLYGGGVLGFGYHGRSIRTYGGFSLPFLKVFTLKGSAEFYRQFPAVYRDAPYNPEYIDLLWEDPLATEESVDAVLAALPQVKEPKIPRNAVLFTAGLKLSFSRIGLKLYPRVEYITNRHYKEDVRFRFTTDILVRKYWSTGGGQ